MIYQISCPCLFGLESVLAGEIRALGGEEVQIISDGRVNFSGDARMIVKANLWLRTAERVQIMLGSYPASTFEELFEGMRRLPLERFIGPKDAFPVKGWSLNSTLTSIPSCQSILKKAAVKRLSEKYHISWFEESGPVRQLQFALLKDQASIFIDTSGIGLHKRGYRPAANEAPIKETLAAGILQLARIREDSNLIDPFCGSGTFLIEGAMMAAKMAPGLRRSFGCESWNELEGVSLRELFTEERDIASRQVIKDIPFTAQGYDIDPRSVELTVQNACRAGVSELVKAEQRDIGDFHTDLQRAVIVCNPPYGERMLEIQEAEDLYRTMGKVFEQRKFLNYYIISPDEEFERLFGLGADKRRKLYNGMIRCQLYMYFKGGVPLGGKPRKARERRA
ncbi:MAG: class I SAM-dependent RNA methyltransferase [Oscillospiraceae bacterium]|jgi:putative N6-adenine-specific DNA methylase|nr:class I SAM-dependent RNA methyltransferase [Oscillospiraceae bacterium]